MNRRGTLTTLAASMALGLGLTSQVLAADTIKVGVLHSLSGTMAISETVLKDTVLMAIDEINAKGVEIGGAKVKFELVPEDDQADPKQGTIVAQKFRLFLPSSHMPDTFGLPETLQQKPPSN